MTEEEISDRRKRELRIILAAEMVSVYTQVVLPGENMDDHNRIRHELYAAVKDAWDHDEYAVQR